MRKNTEGIRNEKYSSTQKEKQTQKAGRKQTEGNVKAQW